MDLQGQLAAELRRRAARLPANVAAWKTLADQNQAGMGIHQTQIAAITLLLDSLPEVQGDALAALDPALAAEDFAARRATLQQVMSGSSGILAIFAYMFEQRLGSADHQAALAAADLIAADCYRPCIARAQNPWGALPADHFREPPLTYLNALGSPVAFTRRNALGALHLPLDAYLDLKLPIAVIALPFDHTAALWTYCALYHEVGHVLDQDLQLRAALSGPLQQWLTAHTAAADRLASWDFWLREVIGDAVGVLFGGGAFAYSLLEILFLARATVVEQNAADPHPPPYVRVFLLAALLRETGVAALAPLADEIEQLWRARYGDAPELAALLGDCPVVAHGILNENLAALHGHALPELLPPLADAHAQMVVLAAQLLAATAPATDATFPIHLVPAAAQLAVHQVTDGYDAAYEAIHQRACTFLAALPHDAHMAGTVLSPGRQNYLRSLVRAIDFRALADAAS